ncbi:MAG: hypothetical protein KC418_03705 [Anaerolineales bacterium]|nr:hypothetical protein [Anaerolineales bacterium]
MSDAPSDSSSPWRRHRSDWKWIILLGLLIQAGWGARLTHPSYMDAYYYTTSGHRLAQGYGFTTQVVWQYLDQPQSIPAPSHTYWMPLPALLAAAGYAIADNFRAAQIPFWLLAGLLPWLSFLISSVLSGERWQAWTAALFTAAGGYYAAYFSQPTTFAPFAWGGGLGLLALAWATMRPRPRYWLLAGFLAGLAHLTRADGLLFLLVGGGLWGVDLARTRAWRQGALAGLALLCGYLLVMLPWFWHNMVVLGRPLPTVGTQTIFLTTYDDLFAYNRTFTWQTYLAWGWGNILRSKLAAFWLAIQTFIAVSGLIFLSPFILLAWVRWGRADKWPWLRPLTWYALGLLAVMVLVFTFPSGRGSVLHSSAAIWPWMTPLAAGGIGMVVDAVAGRLSHWQPARAKRMFAGMFLLIAAVVSLVTSGVQPLRDKEASIVEQIGRTLPSGTIVMLPDSPMYYYHTGNPAINLPNEPPDTLLQVADKFHATYLILDPGYPAPLQGIYDNTSRHPRIHFVADYDGIRLYQLLPP